MKYRFAILVSAVLLFSCAEAPVPVELKPAPTTPPQWSKEAIWYQIMVERFHNGDPTNDPTIGNIQGTYPGYIPDTWQITPWTQDWYNEDAYFEDVHGQADFTGNVVHSFDAKTALRRYGGDLQGVLDKLDYLEKLGVNAIYFNPINDAPSLHKYDARHWRHVDVNFGPDPIGDNELIQSEDPADPNTWRMTSADNLFLEVIKQAKARNIRIILDYSWNHTGHTFWAWRDVLKNQQASQYADWYWVKNFDDVSTPQNEFEYRGWFGVFDLPEIQETTYADHSDRVSLLEGDIKSQAAKSHIMAVTRRWLDPNGDGDPSDGVDGFRLDAAAELPLGFWRDYRTFVKSINPEAYLVGEIWWGKWPDELFDPKPVLQGDVFDAVMNYRWYKTARQYFGKAPNAITPAQFVSELSALTSNIGDDYNYAMMNMSASHDSPRLLTSLFNDNKYKFNAKAAANENYKIHKPDAKTINTAKLLLAHQFTYIGAPQIWAGDEMGMWGSDDPHNRKPLIWPEYSFENESGHPLGNTRPSDEVNFNQALFEYYQFLVNLRRGNPVLSTGAIEFIEQDERKRLLSYRRYDDGGESAYIVFNTGRKRQQIILPESVVSAKSWLVWHSNNGTNVLQSVPSEQLSIDAESAMVIIVAK
ncbi:MAG: glycosidase [Alphaproteobacteria bacterium]|jgi:glycosidase